MTSQVAVGEGLVERAPVSPANPGQATAVSRGAGREVIDRGIAALALLCLAPLLVVVAVAIRATSPGPVLFGQVRVGLHGRRFRMWKFRTMRAGAETELHVVAHLNAADGCLFKVREDPRVTRVGRWLRRHSIDEVPQFWNVLRGEMALVGPRPPLPREVEKYCETARRRLAVKPGMTGLWQVSGRAELTWEETVRLDLQHVENSSALLDVAVLLRTLAAVIHGRGAY